MSRRSRNEENNERWENMVTQAGSFVAAASDARARGDNRNADHWTHMADVSLNLAETVREDR
jgi:hypothetical protein